MVRAIHDFTYDGTFEGLLSVYIKCIAMKVRPLDIRPDFMVSGKPFEEKCLYVRTNPGLADRFYRYMGQCASARVQQMMIDCFLTSLPRMELDLYEFVSRAIRFGGSVADDYGDETMRRIQMAVRDLYRESQTVVQSVDLYKQGDGVSVTSLNPRNRVLPLIRHKILNDPLYDDLLIYDKRHCLLLMRHGSEDDIIDIRRLPIPVIQNPREVYEAFWPYVTGEREVTCRVRGDTTHKGSLPYGRGADSLEPLWHIA